MFKKSEQKLIAKLASVWKKRLQLTDWRILVKFDDIAENMCGTCQPDETSMTAMITLNNLLAQQDNPEMIPSTVCHEMLHVMMSELTNIAKNRYASEDEIDRAAEKIVLKLERAFMEDA